LAVVAQADVAELVAILVGESRCGIGMPALVSRTGLLASEIESITRGPNFVTLTRPEFWAMNGAWFQSMVDDLAKELRRFHQKNPLLPGIAKQDLRGQRLADAPPFVLDALLAAGKQIAVEGDIVRLATHQVVLQEDEQRARESIEGAFEQAGLAVPSLVETLAQSHVEMKRARSILQILLREKKLIRISEDLVFHHSAIRGLRELLATRRSERFGVPTFKDWTGVSRKYAIPLLEYLDRERVTRREGDERIVL